MRHPVAHVRGGLAFAAVLGFAACVPRPPGPRATEARTVASTEPRHATTVRPPTEPTPSAAAVEPAPRAEREVAEELAAVARAHGLDVKARVPARVVSREEGIRLIIAKTEQDLPREVLAAQGEFFSALELAPADYAFVDGMFAQVKENIAGFYDPDGDTMYLLDDLDATSRRTTLAHELVHALQDQHFRLGERMTYRRGDLDLLAALSCFAEGDATSAMFEATGAPRGFLSVENLRRSMAASVALSATGYATPPAMQASLIAPYVDGYRFVEALRDRGGWEAVNRAWDDPPRSTEQVLHLDKFDLREPPIDVPLPTADALGSGYRLLDADVGGELSLRIAFEPWSSPPEAAVGAAGWGGDRYALFAKDGDEGQTIALAWRIVFDDEPQAVEAARLLERRFAPCRERADLGPIAWSRRARSLTLVAGPYVRRRDGHAVAAKGATCAVARRWLDELRRAP
jgi:hypothetical protein